MKIDSELLKEKIYLEGKEMGICYSNIYRLIDKLVEEERKPNLSLQERVLRLENIILNNL